LFSGEFWTGHQALGFGVVDQLGDLRTTLRERFGEKVQMPLVSAERGLFGRRIPGLGERLAEGELGLADDVISALEARALWARYGL
jgi:ClpP class serine protease